MRKQITIDLRAGQTLITLLVFIVVATTITTTAVAILLNTTESSSIASNAISATQIADSGAENAILRLIRDPSYTGEDMDIGNGNAHISVSGTNPKTITSIGSINNFKKTVQVIVTYNNNIMSVSSWNYVY